MRAIRATLAVFGLSVMASGAMAQGPVVVELFTSQGCSNCPPVDAMLGELAEREDVIALALHVDYWDYIGWADTFASPAFTARQHAYARAGGSTVVYTPQLVIGGQAHMVGNQPMAVFNEIMAYADMPDPVVIAVAPEGDGVRVTAALQDEAAQGPMVVQLVRYTPHEEVAIRRGENADQTFDYHNIVRDWQIVAEWDGRSEFSAVITRLGSEPHVVIVQEAGMGAILGAARLD